MTVTVIPEAVTALSGRRRPGRALRLTVAAFRAAGRRRPAQRRRRRARWNGPDHGHSGSIVMPVIIGTIQVQVQVTFSHGFRVAIIPVTRNLTQSGPTVGGPGKWSRRQSLGLLPRLGCAVAAAAAGAEDSGPVLRRPRRVSDMVTVADAVTRRANLTRKPPGLLVAALRHAKS